MKLKLSSALLFLFIVFSCQKENQPPTIEITSPTFGAKFQRGEIVVISVDAKDEDGSIEEVRFYIDDIGISSVRNFPYKYEWYTGDESPGNHIIKAVAIDNGYLETETSLSIAIEIYEATVITGEAKDISYNSVTYLGEVTEDGGSTVTQRGFYWSKTNNTPDSGDNKEIVSGTIGTYNKTISSLTANTTYYYRAFATNSKGIATGGVQSFKTEEDPGGDTGTLTDSRDNKTYKTITIGNLIWMAENLAYDAGSGCWAYNNDEDNVATYGRLYTWAVAKTACPSGWHLSTDAEWKQMEMAIGMSQSEADDTGWRGTNEGDKLKATSGWYNNGNGTDDFGFSGLPGGYCGSYGGHFVHITHYGYWWSATESSTSNAWFRYLSYDYTDMNRGSDGKEYGFSVRCVRD